MQNFIVLGIIPGTNFQTTFNFWLTVAIGLSTLVYMPKLIAMGRQLRLYIAARQIAHTINRFELIAL